MLTRPMSPASAARRMGEAPSLSRASSRLVFSILLRASMSDLPIRSWTSSICFCKVSFFVNKCLVPLSQLNLYIRNSFYKVSWLFIPDLPDIWEQITMALHHGCFKFSNKSIFGPFLNLGRSCFHRRYQSSALLFFFLFAWLSPPLFCRGGFPQFWWRDSPFAWRFSSRMSQPFNNILLSSLKSESQCNYKSFTLGPPALPSVFPLQSVMIFPVSNPLGCVPLSPWCLCLLLCRPTVHRDLGCRHWPKQSSEGVFCRDTPWRIEHSRQQAIKGTLPHLFYWGRPPVKIRLFLVLISFLFTLWRGVKPRLSFELKTSFLTCRALSFKISTSP